LVARNQFIHPSVMFRAELIRSLGGYDPHCHLREDYELWLRVARASDVANLAEPLVDYRLHDDQSSAGTPGRASLARVASAQRKLGAHLNKSALAVRASSAAWRAAQSRAGQLLKAFLMRRGGGRGASISGPTTESRASRLERQIADGYDLASPRDVHRVLTEALAETDRVAEALGLDFVLIAGSALGALRHQGFIPWDDDIDVAMSLPDLEVFAARAPELFDRRYFLETRQSDNRLGAPCKVCIRSTLIEDAFGPRHNLSQARHRGLFIDVFPLWPLSERTAIRLFERGLAWCIYVKPWALRMVVSPEQVGVARRLRFLCFGLVPARVLESLGGLLLRVASGRDAVHVGLGMAGIHGGPFKAEQVLPSRPVPFEGHVTRGPSDLQRFVEASFGATWRELPPESERRGHATRSWLKRGPASQ
jgi:lipopolysaccharide cholinephosphotransferase